MNKEMIQRHTKAAIFMHWFNAICWIFLLVTGLGLIKNPSLSPVGMWWPTLLQELIGGGNLLYLHAVTGVVWTSVFVIYLLINPKQHLVSFLKDILTISLKRDLSWLVKKLILMTLGKKVLKKLGMDEQLPEQGFYNVGQKLFAIPATFGGVVIVVTGIIMIWSKVSSISIALVQWSILLHFLTVGLVFAGLLIHIYMAAIVEEEKPAFRSMFTGWVPKTFAKHHNKLWYLEQEVAESDMKN